MRKLVMGCAVAALIGLSPKSEARVSETKQPLPPITRKAPTGEVGLASWYGKERQGKETASGELFDMNGFTAAHRTLPLGSRVRVTNLANLKSTVVRINDRGPGIPNRIIDLSWAAAKKLGYTGEGLTMVEVVVVPIEKGHPGSTNGLRSARIN